MATVTKLWEFLTTAEGFVEVGDSAISLTLDTGGNPARSLEFLGAASGTTERIRSATALTWEDWTVPAGATVTNVQILGFDSRLYNSGASRTGTLVVRVVDSGGTTVHSAGDLFTRAAFGPSADGGWVSGSAGTLRAVDSGKQASNTQVRLEVQLTLSGVDSGWDLGIDNISLQITYTAGGGGATVTAVAMLATGDVPAAGVSGDTGIIAVPMAAVGDVVAPTIQAGSTVIAVVMAGTGDIASNIPISSEVGAVALVMSGDMGEGAVISGVSGATVVGVPMVATGDLVAASVGQDQNVVAVPMLSTADLVAASVSADSVVIAVPMAALGDVVAAALTSGSNVGATIMLATGDMIIPAILIDGVPVGGQAVLTLQLMGVGS